MTDFKPANRLEELLVRAASDPVARPGFYRELLRATLYLLTPEAPAAETSSTAPAGATLNIVNWRGPSGPITPIFSARERVEHVVRETGQVNGFVALEGSAVFGMLAQQPRDAILNPGFPYGKQFTPEEIGRLAEGTVFEPERRETAQPTRVLLGQPAVYPQALVDALVRLFAGRTSVEAAYLAQIHFPDEATSDAGVPHPIIGILSADYEKEDPRHRARRERSLRIRAGRLPRHARRRRGDRGLPARQDQAVLRPGPSMKRAPTAFAQRTVDQLAIGDEPAFRHVALYADLKEVLRRASYPFRVLPKASSGRADRALLLNLSFWEADAGGDVLVDEHPEADVIAHTAWHHLAARALGPEAGGPLSVEALFLGESIASAFDVYLVGRLLGHAPRSSSLATQVPAMAETASAAGLSEGAFATLLATLARDPDGAFAELPSCSRTPRPPSSPAGTASKRTPRCVRSTAIGSARCSIATSCRTGCSMRAPTAATRTRACARVRSTAPSGRRRIPLGWLVAHWVAPALVPAPAAGGRRSPLGLSASASTAERLA